ncbi:MAG: gliding motility-associated C-terminal domain-containing protein [Janthinobacterium lividum]
MIRTLLRRVGLLPGLVFCLLALGTARPALASHLLGGEMTYQYLDANGPVGAPLRYQITISIYNTCTYGSIGNANVGIYDPLTGTKLTLTTTNFALISGGSASMLATTSACLSPGVGSSGTGPIPGCTSNGPTQQYVINSYSGIVNLPLTTTGYYAAVSFSDRNYTIANLNASAGVALALYTTLAPPTYPNSSPIFTSQAVALICANDTTVILNSAVDPDGDQLVYSFGQPYGFGAPTTLTPPPAVVAYNPGYSVASPFGTAAGNYASINTATGVAKYRATALGAQYVVAIDVKEYRTINGQQVLIGTTRRDIQLVVSTCPASNAPVLPTSPTTIGGTVYSGIPRTYTIEAGGTLTIPLNSSQPDGHPLSLTASSALLDGAGGYDAALNSNQGTITAPSPAGVATVTTSASVSGATTLTAAFVFKPTCSQVRAQPYDVSLTLQDQGCAGKTAYDVIRVTVVKPAGPTNITGNTNVCGLNTKEFYTATYTTGTIPNAPNVSWRVVGGVFTSNSGNNPVQVQWTTAGTGLIVARGIGVGGCLTDSVSKVVTVTPSPTLTVAPGVQTVCQGTSATLSFTGSTSYTLTGGGVTLTGAGPFTVTPTQTTTYTVNGTAATGGCPATTQVTITVLPAPTANAGPAVTTCSGSPATIGTAPVSGYTYSWSPTNGLSNPNIANPTITITNNSAAAFVVPYTLTVLNSNFCPATSTVVVTVNPGPVAPTINGSRTICTLPTTGTYTIANATVGSTFQWTVNGGTVTAGQGTASVTVSFLVGITTATIGATETSQKSCVGQAASITVGVDNAQAPAVAIASVVPTDNTKVTITFSVPTPGTATNSVQILRRDAGTSNPFTPVGTATASTGTITFTDATANAALTSYEYTVARNNACGNTLTATATATTILLKAAGVAPNAAYRSGTANLTWNAYQSPGFTVAGYRLYRQDDNKGYSLIATVSASTTPLQYTSINTGTGFNQCFRVVAFSATGAESNSNTACVDFENKMVFYNVITPNNDGKNDKLLIDNVVLYPNNTMTIFNRWGRQVFSTTNYNNSSNTWGDDSISPGVYYYLFESANGPTTKGWVEVIK